MLPKTFRSALPLFRWTSWRHLRARPLRTALTVLGVALGVAVVVAVGLVNDSVLRGLRGAAATISSDASLVITGDKTGVPATLLARVRGLDGVLLATPVIKQVTAIRGSSAGPSGGLLLVLGMDLLDERLRDEPDAEGISLSARDPVALLENTYSLLLSENLARSLGVVTTGGAILTLGTPDGLRPFSVQGALRGARLRDLGDRIALMDVEAAAKAFGKVDRYDEVRVRLPPGLDDAQRSAMVANVRAAAGTGFEVERPQDRGQPAERVLATWQSGLSFIALLTLLVGMFLAYQAVAVAVAERRREIGTLRSLGATRRAIVLLFLGDAALFGIAGSALGLVLGVLLAQGLLAATGEMIRSYVVYVDLHRVFYDAQVLAGALCTGVGACLAAGLAPALSAARLAPIDALARDVRAAPVRAHVRRRALLGLVVLSAALLTLAWPAARANEAVAGTLLVLTIAGFLLTTPLSTPALLTFISVLAGRLGWSRLELGLHNARRSPERAAVTVNAVIVGAALCVSTAALAKSFEGATLDFLHRSIPADLVLTAGTELYGPTSMPMSDGLAKRVAGVAGVADVQGIRYTDARLRGARVDVLSFDTRAWSRRARLRAIEGEESEIVRGLGRAAGVTVSENLARVFGVHAGDEVRLRTPRGEAALRVLGVVADYSSPFGVVAMDRALYRRHWDDDKIDQLHVFVKTGADALLVREVLVKTIANEHDVFVLTSGEVRSRVQRMIEESFAIVRLQEVIAILVALLGLASLLAREVLYRARELGILRALGATRRTVAALVVVEAVALGGVGVGLGLLLGAVLAIVNLEALTVAQMGWRFPYSFPWLAAGELAGALLAVAALASWWPARRAAATPLSKSLREE